MHLDEHGLPVQRDGDAQDQLQRCSMIVAARKLGGAVDGGEHAQMATRCALAMAATGTLQEKPGIYSRYTGGPTDTVSGDQLLSALAAWVAHPEARANRGVLAGAIISRLGFAQNTRDGLDGGKDTRWKLPDFILLRATPLMLRINLWFRILNVIGAASTLAACVTSSPWWALNFFLNSDIYLVFMALGAVMPVWKDGGGWKRRGPGDVDDNVTIMTLAVCHDVMPSFTSRFACWLYGKLRPWNYGCAIKVDESDMYVWDSRRYHPVYGALRWYHRESSGGNPEIAEMWKPICDRIWGKK